MKKEEARNIGTFHGDNEVPPLRKYHCFNQCTQNKIASKCMTKMSRPLYFQEDFYKKR